MRGNTLFKCLYPDKCAACNEIIEENKALCDYCRVFIDADRAKNICVSCGAQKDACRCKFREYRFKGITAVYKNEGLAKKIYYAYKLGKREDLARFLAQKVTQCVKSDFKDLEFDALCYVPTSIKSRLKNGFDHNRTIASMIAENLAIECLHGALKVKPFKRPQHKSSFRQRLENIKGKYYTKNRIDKKRVLLFDDIVTTGSTLDEAAKELMFAGVQEVYCVSILTTSIKRK